jgi:hypothetical protein
MIILKIGISGEGRNVTLFVPSSNYLTTIISLVDHKQFQIEMLD